MVGAKIFGAKVHSSSELRVFRHLWSRSDAPCSSIMYQGRNHWRVGLSGPPTFWRTPQLLIQRFCRGVHRQASRVNLVYNTEEERKKKFFLLLLQVLSAFLFHIMALHLAMRIILRLWSTCEQYHIASLNQHRRAWEHSTKGLGCCRASRPCHCNATNNAGVLTEFELSEYRYSCYNC